MKKYDIAVLDFETMNEHMNSPCEVAVSLIKDLSIVKVYSSYINPPNNRYNLKNAKIHKIPEGVILKAPKYPDIYQEILYLLKESHLIIAHNAPFDISVLKNTNNYYDIPTPNFLYVDSINIFKKFHAISSFSLENLCDLYGIDKESLHSAKYDVLALSEMLISLAKNNQFSSVLELIHYTPKQYVRFSKYLNSTTKLFDSGFQKNYMKISEINKIEVESVVPFLKDKNVVFTGNFDIEKQDLMILTRKKGAYIRSGVSVKTDILVEGVQDDKYKDMNGLVSKQRKAREYVKNGAKIHFLNEEDLLNLIKE
ncbi:TPA: ATP-dependent helicase [Staphylococcus aureus]|nr:ATP-dependent helicase [Staphylococcus aureus]HEK6545001.1 ATP-dependent helicase [Staphylococcus aureus]